MAVAAAALLSGFKVNSQRLAIDRHRSKKRLNACVRGIERRVMSFIRPHMSVIQIAHPGIWGRVALT